MILVIICRYGGAAQTGLARNKKYISKDRNVVFGKAPREYIRLGKISLIFFPAEALQKY
jgi:hypothetical protein